MSGPKFEDDPWATHGNPEVEKPSVETPPSAENFESAKKAMEQKVEEHQGVVQSNEATHQNVDLPQYAELADKVKAGTFEVTATGERGSGGAVEELVRAEDLGELGKYAGDYNKLLSDARALRAEAIALGKTPGQGSESHQKWQKLGKTIQALYEGRTAKTLPDGRAGHEYFVDMAEPPAMAGKPSPEYIRQVSEDMTMRQHRRAVESNAALMLKLAEILPAQRDMILEKVTDPDNENPLIKDEKFLMALRALPGQEPLREAA